MTYPKIHSGAEMAQFVDEIGFLPLLDVGIGNWCADAVVDAECRVKWLPGGGIDWPMWEWKGPIIQSIGCAYGKFFCGKAGFVSRAWWKDFCNWRRFRHPRPAEESVEEYILFVLGQNGSMVSRDLRAACGFTGPKMRGTFDGFITKLQAGCRIVTEDFVYARDRHDRPYGWGLSLLTTPENLLGRDACRPDCPPEESYSRLYAHFQKIIPFATTKQIEKVLG